MITEFKRININNLENFKTNTDFVLFVLKNKIIKENKDHEFWKVFFIIEKDFIIAIGVSKLFGPILIEYKDDPNNIKNKIFNYVEEEWENSSKKWDDLISFCLDKINNRGEELGIGVFGTIRMFNFIHKMEEHIGKPTSARIIIAKPKPLKQQNTDNGEIGQFFSKVNTVKIDNDFYIFVYDGEKEVKFKVDKENSFFLPNTNNIFNVIDEDTQYLLEYNINRYDSGKNTVKILDPFYDISIGFLYLKDLYGVNMIFNAKNKISNQQELMIHEKNFKPGTEEEIKLFTECVNNFQAISPYCINGTNVSRKIQYEKNETKITDEYFDFPAVHLYGQAFYEIVEILSSVNSETFSIFFNKNVSELEKYNVRPIYYESNINNENILNIKGLISTLNYSQNRITSI